MEFKHTSVLPVECIEGLNIKQGGIYVDGTTGGGGHSKLILEKLSAFGKLICIDRDRQALESAKSNLKNFKNTTFVKGNFCDIKNILSSLKIEKINGMLLDLGVSSHQIDTAERGFSYMADGPLDMRMDSETPFTAADIVNNFSLQEIAKILREYGEEEFAFVIAKKIVLERKVKIETTGRLKEIVDAVVPVPVKIKRGNACKKTFQALRIAVNGELDAVKKGVEEGFNSLASGGRLCVITFHSLEDRIVKNLFAEFAKGCICIENSPVCICGRKPKGKIITKKPITANETELKTNKRSKSAKLRIIEKI